MLGRPHEVRGIVAHGDKRGRELGFPTANVAVPGEILLPADGIYAGWFVRADGSVLPTAISLGRRPTFYDEAHVACSRPTSSTSPATSTASTSASGSSPGCGARRSSTPSTP